MGIVTDTRPVEALAHEEIVAPRFRAVRAHGWATGDRVWAVFKGLFPDLPPARRRADACGGTR